MSIRRVGAVTFAAALFVCVLLSVVAGPDVTALVFWSGVVALGGLALAAVGQWADG